MFKESVKQQTAEQGAVFPLSVADAKRAVSYVRGRATEFGVDPNRVGMIGFSAGAMIALAAAVSSGEREGPDFIAPIYGTIAEYMRPFVVPPTAVPIFLAAASDDQLGFATCEHRGLQRVARAAPFRGAAYLREGRARIRHAPTRLTGRFVERKV